MRECPIVILVLSSIPLALGICGDGVRDKGEQCDRADLGQQTCVGLGYSPGLIVCRADCVIDHSQCKDEYRVPLRGQWAEMNAKFGSGFAAHFGVHNTKRARTSPTTKGSFWRINLPTPIAITKVVFTLHGNTHASRASLTFSRRNPHVQYARMQLQNKERYSITVPNSTWEIDRIEVKSEGNDGIEINGFKAYKRDQWRLPEEWISPQLSDILSRYRSPPGILPPGCPQVCLTVELGGFGQTNNQIIAFANALSAALRYNWTLVTDDFFHIATSTTTNFTQLLNIESLRRHTCVLLRKEIKWNRASCIPGVWMISNSSHAGQVGNYFYTPAYHVSPSIARRLMADISNARRNQTDGEVVSTKYRHLASLIRPMFLMEFAPFYGKLLEYLPPKYHAVHLRQKLSGKFKNAEFRRAERLCEYRMAGYTDLHMIPLMCSMPEKYIRARLQANGFTLDENNIVIVAQDGANLYKSPYIKTLSHYVPKGSPLRAALESDFQVKLMAEMFMLVHAEVFLGNPMSTVSQNVCALRGAKGKRCDNFMTCELMFGWPHPLGWTLKGGRVDMSCPTCPSCPGWQLPDWG